MTDKLLTAIEYLFRGLCLWMVLAAPFVLYERGLWEGYLECSRMFAATFVVAWGWQYARGTLAGQRRGRLLERIIQQVEDPVCCDRSDSRFCEYNEWIEGKLVADAKKELR